MKRSKESVNDKPTKMRCASCASYIEIDREAKECYISDYIADTINHKSRGRLTQINYATGEKIENYFNIKLEDYGVEVLVTQEIIMEVGQCY